MVEPILIEGEIYDAIPLIPKTPSLLPVFRCKFDEVLEGSYVYDIYWYINGDFIKKLINISYTQVNTTDMTYTDWNITHHLNMKVRFHDKRNQDKKRLKNKILTYRYYDSEI